MLLLVASCTADGAEPLSSAGAPPDAASTTALPPATTSSPSTTASPSPSSTTTPLPSTTTLPPGLQPQILQSGLRAGTLVAGTGTLGTRVEVETAAEPTGESDIIPGSLTVDWSGRRRLLALDAGEGVEVVEDFIAESGRAVSEIGGERMEVEASRDDLLGFKPDTSPAVLDASLRLVPGAIDGAPFASASPPDWLDVVAQVGPSFGGDPVDVGDDWTVTRHDDVLGTVTVTASVVEETEIEPGRYVFTIDFLGSASDLPVSMDFDGAVRLADEFGWGETGLVDLLGPQSITGDVTVRSKVVEGSMVFDPALGLASSFESREALTVEVGPDDVGVPADVTINVSASRSFEMEEVRQAASFEIESVLDRFEVDPFTLAARAIDDLPGYELAEASDDQVSGVLDPLSNLRGDLFAGFAIRELTNGSGAKATLAALTTGGEYRGAPFVAEEVARFLTSGRPSKVTLGNVVAWRATIGKTEWLLFGNQTHLFIAIGARAVAQRIIRDVAASAVPYQWAKGDCMDFSDGFADATPYAPFGMHGLRHCALDHTHEVIYSETLSTVRDDPFPSDLADRSDAACGRAFYELTGTTELESALSLTRYLPDRDEWAQGSRYLACVVAVTGPDGPVAIEGRVDGTDPSLTFSLGVGTCLSDFSPGVCNAPHNGEIISAFDLEEGPGVPRPAVDEVRERMRLSCEGALAEFDFGEGPGVPVVSAVSDAIVFWDLGVRRYYCLVRVAGPNGLITITGTLAGGWEEAGDTVET